ncbi:hypothetical protein K491DRAFT_753932 [Lophiostoma macrostomum CBS 122681]|uniref:Uncharacterized protein n=1 Tax=Lophiostoma macrostomum CBS 122681 TaxID=1314788 RepID=A0A6A6TPP6_9PLEO|nr:hypothetical protein K491DRAFT_753932 [Lophiostoma macrostomum CBS 122681]
MTYSTITHSLTAHTLLNQPPVPLQPPAPSRAARSPTRTKRTYKQTTPVTSTSVQHDIPTHSSLPFPIEIRGVPLRGPVSTPDNAKAVIQFHDMSRHGMACQKRPVALPDAVPWLLVSVSGDRLCVAARLRVGAGIRGWSWRWARGLGHFVDTVVATYENPCETVSTVDYLPFQPQ